jgi:hypothetical protein
MQQRFKPQVISRGMVQVGIVAVIAVVAVNYQAILDQYALATFQPSSEVASIEGRLGLTTKAKATLYRGKPQIDSKAAFNSDCETQPHELELGCYYHQRIYVLKIDNSNLVSEMDVVTAHELLHAGWNSLGAGERKTLGAELERVYQQVATDDLRERMAGYARSEPGEEMNELHSILGTEFTTLSPMLEEHYAKYFSQRGQIVAAHAAYTAVFNDRRQELEAELASIRALKGQLGVLNRQMETYKANGQIDQYNALVPRQNGMVDDINRRIETYRQGVDEYNALSKSLDSRQITDTESAAQ